jgi:phosphoribosylamine--glycine ligase
MASEGYPGNYERGRPINGLDEADRIPGVKVFHAGTTTRNEPQGPRIVTDGGRVLNVTALGETFADARDRAYQAASAIRFTGGWFRHDIADRALKSDPPSPPQD